MIDNEAAVGVEEAFDTENNDIWDIFFPYMADKKSSQTKLRNAEQREQSKPRRYMRFLTM